MKLETQRLYLYPISDTAISELIDQEPDPEMKQAYSEMLQGCIDRPEARIWYAVWLMELKQEPGVIVGDFCFKGIAPDGMVEIGYGLREGYCGWGYMSETVEVIAAWALTQEGVTRVEAETEPDNLASQKVLQRCGFEATGILGDEGPRFVYRVPSHFKYASGVLAAAWPSAKHSTTGHACDPPEAISQSEIVTPTERNLIPPLSALRA